MRQAPDTFPELLRSGQRLALRGMEAGQSAGEHDEARDGHVRRCPGNLEAVMGGEGAECRDVLPGDLAFGRVVQPLAGQEGEVPRLFFCPTGDRRSVIFFAGYYVFFCGNALSMVIPVPPDSSTDLSAVTVRPTGGGREHWL